MIRIPLDLIPGPSGPQVLKTLNEVRVRHGACAEAYFVTEPTELFVVHVHAKAL